MLGVHPYVQINCVMASMWFIIITRHLVLDLWIENIASHICSATIRTDVIDPTVITSSVVAQKWQTG